MKNNMAWSSLLTGIFAFVFAPLGPILSIVAIITGILGRKRKKERILANIGLILGIAFWILFIIAIITGSIKRTLNSLGL